MNTSKNNKPIKYIMKLLEETKYKYNMNFEEDIYPERLQYLIDHQDEFIEKFDKQGWDDTYNPFTIATKYLSKYNNGSVKVKYHQKNRVGRYFANGFLSMQSLNKEIRHSICKGYIDVDVENAHPVFLLFLCKKLGIPRDNLKYYVKNRKTCLKDLPNGKMVYLSLLNGGTKLYDDLDEVHKTEFIKDFKKEIENIHILLCQKFKKKYKKAKKERKEQGIDFNHKGSFVNKLLCDFENKVLMNIWEFYERPKNAVLCFDGIMIKDNKEVKLKECEAYIKKQMGLTVKLKVKPFDKGFDFTGTEMKEYKGIEYNTYFDYMKLVNQTLYMSSINAWLNNNVSLIDNGGKMTVLTKNGKMDRLTNQYAYSYSQIKTDVFLKTMNFKCLVFNDLYNEELALKVNNGTLNEKDLTPEEKMNIEQFLNGNKPYLAPIIMRAIEEREIKTYAGLEFEPFLKRNGEPKMYGAFNIFTGFPLEDVEENKDCEQFENSPLYNHIKIDMCNNNLEEFERLMDYIADMIQQPAKMRGNAHLFISEQGTGKGLLAFFIQKLLGINHCITFNNISDYFSNFNVEKSNKLFKVIEEISDKGEAFHKADILKADLTKDRERIEPKGIDAYTLNHYARYFLFSNNENAIYIENSDRRYTIHNIANTHANDKVYFKPMWDSVGNNDYCKNAFEFFANRKYEEINVMEAFINKSKKDQKLNNLSITLKMLLELLEDDFKNINRNEKGYCKISEFKDYCKDWCQENTGRFKLSTMKTQLKKFKLEEERIYDKKKKRVRVYNLNSEHIQELFKKYLKDDTMEFDIIKQHEADMDGCLFEKN